MANVCYRKTTYRIVTMLTELQTRSTVLLISESPGALGRHSPRASDSVSLGLGPRIWGFEQFSRGCWCHTDHTWRVGGHPLTRGMGLPLGSVRTKPNLIK